MSSCGDLAGFRSISWDLKWDLAESHENSSLNYRENSPWEPMRSHGGIPDLSCGIPRDSMGTHTQNSARILRGVPQDPMWDSAASHHIPGGVSRDAAVSHEIPQGISWHFAGSHGILRVLYRENPPWETHEILWPDPAASHKIPCWVLRFPMTSRVGSCERARDSTGFYVYFTAGTLRGNP